MNNHRMNYIKKFEELDYLSSLKIQKEIDDEVEKRRLEEIEKKRRELSGHYLDKLSSESERQSEIDKKLEERRELAHLVLQSLIYSEQKRGGFDNFANDLKSLLDKYPIDVLPKSGSGIYRN